MSKKYYKKNDNPLIILELNSDESFDSENNGYIQITKTEYSKLKEIAVHKQFLYSTDYVACKLAEAATEEEKTALRTEYADVLAQRAAARVSINELEDSLK